MPNDRVPRHKQRLATTHLPEEQLSNAPAPAKGSGKPKANTKEEKTAAGTKALDKE